MKVTKKLVAREIIYNVNTHEVEVKEHYKDVLDESLHRKVLKDFPFWSYIIAVIFNIASLVITQNKYIIILSTTIVLAFSYSIYKRIEQLKKVI